MTKLYFEDAEIGTTCTAEPYLVTTNEIIWFARHYDPVPRHIGPVALEYWNQSSQARIDDVR
ncbi:MAG TPA: hypothetical protein VNX23_24655 [Bradyrhizobium sp.]|jgi:hypothetical protein|uniref:hypothetical protein n=1 Tax=Bradyrhizobium sp. TaxID=376 RepID=UPI002BD1D1ED|nr:hypothetical protein [Bradyrhizobium sp.]HXB80559.1 hypothetical protein [Bradyrhizobium sp.]